MRTHTRIRHGIQVLNNTDKSMIEKGSKVKGDTYSLVVNSETIEVADGFVSGGNGEKSLIVSKILISSWFHIRKRECRTKRDLGSQSGNL